MDRMHSNSTRKDEKEDIAFPIKGIIGGLQFHHKRNYKGNFEKTDLYQYMNTHLLRAMNLGYQVNLSSSSNMPGDNIDSYISYLIEQLNRQNQFLENQKSILQNELVTINNQIASNNSTIKNNTSFQKVYKK